MPLRFLKRGGKDTEASAQAQPSGSPRTERSRREDHFEQRLRDALRGQPVEVRGATVLRDVLAFTVTPERPRGALEQASQVKVDYVLVTPGTDEPLVGIVLSSRAYGRDRRHPQSPTIHDSGEQRSIVTVVHLNPNLLPDADSVLGMLRAYLPG